MTTSSVASSSASPAEGAAAMGRSTAAIASSSPILVPTEVAGLASAMRTLEEPVLAQISQMSLDQGAFGQGVGQRPAPTVCDEETLAGLGDRSCEEF